MLAKPGAVLQIAGGMPIPYTSARSLTTLRPYLAAFGLSWAAAAAVVLKMGNGKVFLYLNNLGSDALDLYFGWLTWLAEGPFFVVAACLLFAWHRRSGAAAFLALAVSTGLSQLLKHTVFDDWIRPSVFFGRQHVEFHAPVGVELHELNSFPSGHTTSIFCLACLIALMIPRYWVQGLALLVAWAVGLSRIMQGQHFPFDVLAGSMLGTFSAVLTWWLLFRMGLAREMNLPADGPPAAQP